MIRLSVVVCTYNRADLLKDCLESLYGQSAGESDYEVIVVDNNSTDRTEEVTRGFSGRHSNCRYVLETTVGLSHARNRGYIEARGEYVAYIDDDARAYKDWVESIIGFTRRRPEVPAFGGPYNGFNLTELPGWYKASYGSWSLGNQERPITDREWINGMNMAFNRSVLMELGGFNTALGMSGSKVSYGEETNLVVRIRATGRQVFYLPDMVVDHLIPEYKMSLAWMLKSNYINGFTALETFGFKKEPVKRIAISVCLFLSAVIKFILSREWRLKARLLESFAHFVWHLGLTIRMLRG
jgi:glycosyltransferase involved in cell wall biosynthesis